MSGESKLAYRPEIDGIRAIAVLGVLLFHAGFSTFSGGYAGVDVFFVISGYLITRNILRAIDAGRFSYSGFFINRMRRLFPALLTTVGVSFVIGALLFSPPYMQPLAESAIVSILAASNIYFWSDTGYWDIQASLKPLLHIWSLSVEEQFYFIWPPLLLIASRANNKGIARILLLTTLGLSSLVFAGCLSVYHPQAAFYWMPWRAFEFTIGAAVIWLERAARPQGGLWPEMMAAGGLGMIILPFLFYTESTPFPVPGALLPCIGTALLIWVGGYCATSKLWSNRPLIWVGRISYSLYLVHWPLIVFYTYWRFVPPTQFERITLVIGSFALAIPLNVFIERRFRQSNSASRLSDGRYLRLSCAIATCVILIAFTAKLDDGWPWRVRPAAVGSGHRGQIVALVSRDGPACAGLPGSCRSDRRQSRRSFRRSGGGIAEAGRITWNFVSNCSHAG